MEKNRPEIVKIGNKKFDAVVDKLIELYSNPVDDCFSKKFELIAQMNKIYAVQK